jgi:hypothetical protein
MTMNHSIGSGDGGNADGKIGDINNATRRRILDLWSEGRNIREISMEVGRPLDHVRRAIKEREKSLLERQKSLLGG